MRKHHKFKLRLHRVEGKPRLHSSLGSPSWSVRLRRALNGGRLNPRPRRAARQPQKAASGPRFRPRRSVAKRVLPAGEPSPSRPVVRLRVVGVTVAALFSLMFVRLWYLQVLDSSSYTQTVASNAVRDVKISPPRGLILARRGQILVGNAVSEDVTLSRAAAEQHPGVVGRLAALLQMTPAQVQAQLNNPQFSIYRPVPIMQNAPLADILYIREHSSEFPGVSAQGQTHRVYPEGDTAAHVLGYVGQINAAELKNLKGQGYQLGDQIGQSGLEMSYQRWLQGQPGVQQLEVNAQGQVVGSLGETPPTPGDDIVLNMDLGLQKELDKALAAEIAKLHTQGEPAPSGAAVVMDPNNGHVLAMASYPTYNPSLWVGGISYSAYAALTSPSSHYPLINRAIDGLYTPGSTFKLATATAALQTGIITPNTPYTDTGRFTIPQPCYGKCSFHNAGYEALGTITLPMAIAASDDVFFYNLGYQFWIHRAQYGQSAIQDVANQYGFGELTGIDLPGEVQGRVDSPLIRKQLHALYPKAYPNDTWYAGDNLEMAFGQGGTVLTPIELATAYSTFANGGTRYAPQMVGAIVSPNGKVVKRISPVVTGHVNLPPSIRNPILKGFEMETTNPLGTGYYSFLGFPFSKFPIAGKTGTASVKGKVPVGLYAGFAPANNPKYVAVAVIDQGGYGDTSAALVVRKVWDYLMVHPTPPMVLKLPAGQASSGSSLPGSSATGRATTTRATTTRATTTSGAQVPRSSTAPTRKARVQGAGG